MRTNDGGPAFPCNAGYGVFLGNGMTLRDYFAVKAMPQFATMNSKVHQAIAAYEMADAMLKARLQEQKGGD